MLPEFERAHPHDLRPRAALDAARAFADGAPRSRLQRVTSLDAHRRRRRRRPRSRAWPRGRRGTRRRRPTCTRSPARPRWGTSCARRRALPASPS
ncbi:putative immunity protein [Isoptericola peretonis]|uniref:putative immunity protein n=1 Tax=Isoptericola peretonis TaxID=2918523 RepID=UPI003A522690